MSQNDGGAGLVDLHAPEALGGGVCDPAVLADHADLVEPVLAPDLEVGGVVPGRDLERAGAELGIHVLVGDHGQPAADQGQDRRLADQPRVALVARIDRDRGVGQHRLRPHGGDGDRPRARLQGVVDRVEGVLDGALLDLEVRDRGAQSGVPIDHVVVAVDEPLLEQVGEHDGDRALVVVVHREAFVLVVERRAEALELLGDGGAVQAPPLPDALDEALAPDLLLGLALLRERLLDLALDRDAGVVGAVDPLGAPAAHACDPDADILDRPVEGVAHVQRPGHVRRRDRNRVVLAGRAVRLGVEDPRLLAALEHPRLDVGRLVARAVGERFVAVRGHCRQVCQPSASAYCGSAFTKSTNLRVSRSGAPWPNRTSLGSSWASLRADRRFSTGSAVKNAFGSRRPGRPVTTSMLLSTSPRISTRSDSRQYAMCPGEWPGTSSTLKPATSSPSRRWRSTWRAGPTQYFMIIRLSGWGAWLARIVSRSSASGTSVSPTQ